MREIIIKSSPYLLQYIECDMLALQGEKKFQLCEILHQLLLTVKKASVRVQYGQVGPRLGSVVVEHLPGMWEVGGSIPGRVKQKTLKFEVLLLCLALSINELENDWRARSQDISLGWDITAYPWRGVSVG